MTVLIESGHVAEYPYNHARILWNNVITAMSATGAATGNPASAALTKTTYERWKPTASGDTLTGTFAAQQINAVAIAAHSDLTPTVEVLQDGTWVSIVAFPFEGESLDAGFAEQDYRLISYAPDNEAILLLIKPRICSGVRVTVTYSGTAPTLGVLMAGKVLEMQRPFYSGHNPALLSSQSTVRPNISESGEWLGASQIRQGRNVAMSWENLKAPWVRKNFMPFSEALLTNPFVAAWNPKRFPDAVYCSSSERPQPSNSGTLNYQNISLNARAYSDGTTPEVLALATSTFDELFTFTRDSAATEVGPSGQLREVAADVARFTHDPVTLEPLGLLIEEERTNLLTYPRRFGDSVWTKSQSSVTPSAVVAPDGTLTAFKLSEDTATDSHELYAIASATSGTQYTTTVFAKAAEYDWFQLRAGGGAVFGQAFANFDLTNGVVGIETNLDSASIEDFGNGWFRCQVTATAGSTASTRFGYIALTKTDDFNGLESYAGDGTSGIYIRHAQLEEASFPTTPIVPNTAFTSRSTTATFLDSTGTIQTAGVDVARDDAYGYDSDGVLRPIGLLLEGASENLLTRSAEFDNADWVAANVTKSADVETAPDGNVAADKIVETATTGEHYLEQSFGSGAGTWTGSFFVKAAERDKGQLRAIHIDEPGGNSSAVDFDLVAGTIDSNAGLITNTSITPYADGWFRVIFTWSTTSASIGNFSRIHISNEAGNRDYTGDGTSGLFVWGAQLEESLYATSYIPTAGTTVTRAADVSSSSASTRAADDCVRTLGAEFNAEAFTVYFEYEFGFSGLAGNDRLFTINDGTIDNRIAFTATNIFYEVNDGGVTFLSTDPDLTRSGKAALAFDGANLYAVTNGVESLASISTNIQANAYTQIDLQATKVKDARIYPRALTATELEELTS